MIRMFNLKKYCNRAKNCNSHLSESFYKKTLPIISCILAIIPFFSQWLSINKTIKLDCLFIHFDINGTLMMIIFILILITIIYLFMIIYNYFNRQVIIDKNNKKYFFDSSSTKNVNINKLIIADNITSKFFFKLNIYGKKLEEIKKNKGFSLIVKKASTIQISIGSIRDNLDPNDKDFGDYFCFEQNYEANAPALSFSLLFDNDGANDTENVVFYLVPFKTINNINNIQEIENLIEKEKIIFIEPLIITKTR